MKLFITACLCLAFSAQACAANILFIGDSHCVGPFGRRLDALLRTVPGAAVATYASCASVFHWWETGRATGCGYYSHDISGKEESVRKAPTPIFDDLVKQVKPAMVVVEFGANYGGFKDDAEAIGDMQNLVSKIKAAGAACYWVSAPDSRRSPGDVPRILAMTRKAVLPYCGYFDSTTVTKYPAEGGDGIHYSFPAAIPMGQAWADSVFAAMQPVLAKLQPAAPVVNISTATAQDKGR